MLPKHIAPHRLATGVFIATAFLYLYFPAAKYNFDGVACAIAVDTSDFRHMVHGNHLAYGFLGYLFSKVFTLLGIALPALFALQIFSSLLGAGAVSIFSLLLLECGAESSIALLGAMGLAVSRIYWIWSLEAQVYPLGAFFLFWAAYEAFRPNPRPVWVGLLHASAILGHVGHLMFLPAALYLIRGRGKRLRYMTALCLGVCMAYAAAGIFIMRPESWEEIRVWLLGSAALQVDKSFGWHGGYSLKGIREWIDITLTMTGIGIVGSLVLLMTASSEVVQWKRKKKIISVCLLWLGGYAILFLCWEPYTPVYRITDFAPLWILAVFAMEKLAAKRKVKIAVLAACVAILGGWNLHQDILPAANSDNNVNLQRALWVSRKTPENAWVIADGYDQVYIPYFANRRTINLRYYQNKEPVLFDLISKLETTGRPVFAVPQVLPETWRDILIRNSSIQARLGELELRRMVPQAN